MVAARLSYDVLLVSMGFHPGWRVFSRGKCGSHGGFQLPGSLVTHAEHDPRGFAGAEGGDGFVDLGQREGVRDETLEAHFSQSDEVDEAWDFDVRGDAAAVGSLEDFLEMERQGID